MGYTLLILLSIELMFFYRFNGKNVVSPSFMACASFILATCIYLTGDEYYGYELHWQTIVVILTMLFCIFMGESFSGRINVKERKQRETQPPLTPVTICIILGIVIFILSMIRFYEVYQFSLRAGNTPGNFATMAKYAREAKLSGRLEYNSSIIAGQGAVISLCVLLFSVYALFANKNFRGKFYFRFLFPIACYTPQIFASDDRTTLLRALAMCVIVVFVLIKQKNDWASKGNVKIIFASIMIVALFLVAFRWLGYRTETSLRSEAWDNITEYTSAGLVGLDQYLQKGEAPNILFGQWTLKNVYAILRQWGFSIPVVESFEEFFFYANGESNIYTGFKPYIKDYGMVGAAIAMFLWGALINYWMKYIKKNGAGFLRLCWMGLVYYPIVLISVDDGTYIVLSMNTIYLFFYLILINWGLVKERIKLNTE